MEEKYVAFAIPLFFALIGLELWVTRKERERRYTFQDSITDLSCGVGQQMLEPLFRTAGLAGYVWLYEHARVATIPATSVIGWIALTFGVDFFYYLFHRASHRVNFFWAAHVVHHQSEEYNLAVALRQSWIEVVLSPVFYLPLAIVGYSPVAFVGMSTLNTLYQFWIHTRVVGRLGFLEHFMNTPSHHRVHHGTNPKYIDKNYAGVFIIWDRLLGTFQDEEEEPVYGTVKPLQSWNPAWANVHYWIEMAEMAGATKSFADKLRVLWKPPEWRPLDLSNGVGHVTIPEVSRETQRKYHVPVSRRLAAYVGVNFAIVAAAVMGTLLVAESSAPADIAIATTIILITLVVWSGLFEAKPWGAPLEIVRLAMVVGAVAWIARGSADKVVAVVIAASLCLAMAAWFGWCRTRATERREGASF